MGNEYSGTIRPELQNSKKVTGYNPGQLKSMREKFVLMCDDDLSIDLKNFLEILRLKDEEASDIFKLFDADGSGKIDSYEFICGLTLLSYTTLKVVASHLAKSRDYLRIVRLRRKSRAQQGRADSFEQVCYLLSALYVRKEVFPINRRD